MILKLNYPMKDAVNLFGRNKIVKKNFKELVFPKPGKTSFTNVTETG